MPRVWHEKGGNVRNDRPITFAECRSAVRNDGLQMKTVLGYTFPDFLEAIVSRYNDLTCYRIFNTGISFTYGQMKDCSESIASYLINHGIEKGDKVAVLGESSPMWMIMYLGIVSIGAIAVPILPDFPECDVKMILRLCKAKGIAVSRKYMSKIRNIENALIFRLDDLTCIGSGNDKPEDITKSMIDRDKLLKGKPDEQDIASIIFTSGTTGASKGVMLSHMNLLRCADQTGHESTFNPAHGACL